MGKFINLSGERYGRLKVLDYFFYDSSGRIKWLCECDCGRFGGFKSANLRGGCTKSCGCFFKERRKNGFSKKHGKTDSPEYRSYFHMKERCYKDYNKDFRHYGGRGITVCDRWLESFENFYEDMGDRPGPEYSLDRIDVNGNYCKENCKWSTQLEQVRNTRRKNVAKYKDNIFGISELAEKFEMDIHLIRYRNYRGWELYRTLDCVSEKDLDKKLEYYGFI